MTIFRKPLEPEEDLVKAVLCLVLDCKIFMPFFTFSAAGNLFQISDSRRGTSSDQGHTSRVFVYIMQMIPVRECIHCLKHGNKSSNIRMALKVTWLKTRCLLAGLTRGMQQ